MALSTYSDLKTSVADWLRRSDLTSAVPDFITLAEAQMNRQLRVRPMMARVTATISDEYSATPSDLIEVRSITLAGEPLQYRTPMAMDLLASQDTAATQPTDYSVVGSELRYYPAPDTSYSAALLYWQRIPALSASNTTNWVLTNHPDAYLYGALVQSAPYLRADDRLAVWGGLFTQALADIKTHYRDGPAKLRSDIPVMGRSFDINNG